MEAVSIQELLKRCDPGFAAAWDSLATTATLLGAFVDAACIMTVDSDHTAKVIDGKLRFDELFGTSTQEWDENFFSRVALRDRSHFEADCATAMQTEKPVDSKAKFRVLGPDGRLDPNRSVFTQLSIQRVGSMGDTAILYLAIRDITHKLKADRVISHEQYSASLRAIFNEVVLLDLDSGESTPIYLGGAPLFDENGKHATCGLHRLSEQLHPDDKRAFWKHANKHSLIHALFDNEKSEAVRFDMRRLEKDGDYHWVSVYIARIEYGDDSRSALICLRNIDAQMEAQRRERELRGRAQQDGLTGVYNRGTTEELVTALIEASSETDKPALAVLDVDNFKHVNDTYGHIMGDVILKGVAESIGGITLNSDDVVGRLGGDEFAVLFAHSSESILPIIQNRLERCIADVKKVSHENGIEPPVTLSIGLVQCDETMHSFHDAFAIADEMLYRMKKAGKNGCCLYQPEETE